MSADINEVLRDMALAFKMTAGNSWKAAKSVVEEFTLQNNERIALLIKFRQEGKLSDIELGDRLKDEKLLLEAQLNAIAILGKASVQKAVNAAFTVLEKALLTITP